MSYDLKLCMLEYAVVLFRDIFCFAELLYDVMLSSPRAMTIAASYKDILKACKSNPFLFYIVQHLNIGAGHIKDDKKVRRTVLNSIVGTLDISIKQFMQGETHPGEIKKLSAVLASQDPFGTHKYAYIANVCVAKFARRQGIATNMLYLATDVSTIAGMKQLFVHVNADNKPAQDLYKKAGFQAVEEAASPTSKDQRILMSMEL
ncbi:hypothetical protein ACS0TY_005278 [Phlomoides rotata]